MPAVAARRERVLPPRSAAFLLLVALGCTGASIFSSTGASNKMAIYWKGDNLAFDEAATANVTGRGFTHVFVSSIEKGEWFANSTQLRAFWDVGTFLRARSPYENETAFNLANAALKKQVQLSSLAGIAEDIEIHPFPFYSATKQGGVVNFTDLDGRIGLTNRTGGSWPSFADWPKTDAHRFPGYPLTMENIEFNFPQRTWPASPQHPPLSAADSITMAGAEGVLQVAQELPISLFGTGITRIDVWVTVPSVNASSGEIAYFVCGALTSGLPNFSRPVLCANSPGSTCQINVDDVPPLGGNVPGRIRLYLNPSTLLNKDHTYFFVMALQHASTCPHCRYTISTTSKIQDAKAVLIGDNGHWAALNGRNLWMEIYSASPPPGFAPNEFRADWLNFQCFVNSLYVKAYADAIDSDRQRTMVYSGYSGHTYKQRAQNYLGSLKDSYSVNWTMLSSAGLDIAAAGYGTQDVNATLRALAAGSAHRNRLAVLLGGARSSQEEFDDRYRVCNGGAMEWYPGGFAADPGFVVPATANDSGRRD